ncbi:MAG: helix-turn-helix domain-containing protein [Actinomycetota bacterium]|nr:helix-turn-helix domain-containing protein [Actinomycetota bacterium]
MTWKGLEIVVLRHQLNVLRRQVKRPALRRCDRALLVACARKMPRARWSCFFVTPKTLLRWHRELVRRKWGRYAKRRTGRPPLASDVSELVLRLAKENPRWGYKRIQGELKSLGIDVSATAIRVLLRRRGLDPAPRRGEVTWRQFLAQSLDLQAPGHEEFENPPHPAPAASVRRRDQLGGLIHEYYEAVA